MNEHSNLSDEQKELYQQGRIEGIREAIELLTSLKECRLTSDALRGIWAAVDEEGWQFLSLDQRQSLFAAACVLAKKIGDKEPILDAVAHSTAISKRDKDLFDREMQQTIKSLT